MKIIGIGEGDLNTIDNWVEEESFGYEVWRDDGRALATAYGAISSPSQGAYSRITVLLSEDGSLLVNYNVGIFGFSGHPSDVLEDCQAIWGSR